MELENEEGKDKGGGGQVHDAKLNLNMQVSPIALEEKETNTTWKRTSRTTSM